MLKTGYTKPKKVAVDVEKFIEHLRYVRMFKKENVEYTFNYFCNMHRSVGKHRGELYARLMDDRIL